MSRYLGRLVGVSQHARHDHARRVTLGVAQLATRGAPAHRRRLDHVLAGTPADEPPPPRHHLPAVALGRRLDPEVDDVEVAQALRRLRHLDFRAGLHRDVEDIAEALPDGRLLGLDARRYRDRRRVVPAGPDDHREQQEKQRAPHCRRSRMWKKRSRASVYGRSVAMPMASTPHARSMRSRAVRAAAERAANASRTRALPVSST